MAILKMYFRQPAFVSLLTISKVTSYAETVLTVFADELYPRSFQKGLGQSTNPNPTVAISLLENCHFVLC